MTTTRDRIDVETTDLGRTRMGAAVRRRGMVLMATALVGASASSALAQVHEGDIILRVDSGAITTHATDGGPTTRVFLAPMGVVAPDFADVGFDCLPGTLPSGTRLGFVIPGPLKVWDGTDFGQDAPTNAGTNLGISYLTLSAQAPAPGAPAVTTFTVGRNGNGQWHRHFDFELLTPAPDPAIYAIELSLFATGMSVAPSEPFWIVLNDGMPAGDASAAATHLLDLISGGGGGGCPADINDSGGVPDIDDILAFFDFFNAGDDRADFNGSGGVPDIDDLLAFFEAFNAPCE